MTNKLPFDGVRGGAILLMSLDEDTGAEIMKQLTPPDVQALSLEMSRIGQISHDELNLVLEQFMDAAEAHSVMNVDIKEHLRAILTKAKGEEFADHLLDEITEENNNPEGIERLNQMDASTVAEMIRDEHTQIITTILVNLKREQAANVLELFDTPLRNEVILRISTYKGAQKDAMAELTKVLNVMLDGQNTKRSKMGGVRAAAEILNTMNSTQEESAISAIREYNDELAQKILDEMFLFENLLDLDNASIMLIIAEVNQDDLAIALKGAPHELQDKFTKNMSTRGAEMFKEDMENRGPVRMSQVESQQKKVLEVVHRLAAAGTIVISGGDDALV